MDLVETYRAIRPAVVAFMPKYLPVLGPNSPPPEVPPIVGTGFILADGLVATNAHVTEKLMRLPMPKDAPKGDWPFYAVLFHLIEEGKVPSAPDGGMGRIQLEVLGVFNVGDIELSKEGHYYGSRRPDFAIVHVKAKGLPSIKLSPDTSLLREGAEIATVGYPMGTDTLTAPGWLHHIGPTLQRGIISAVLPFSCKAPHSFVIDLMSLGGASGSPVFPAQDPRAIGILNAGLQDVIRTFAFDHLAAPQLRDYAHINTNLSYVVPAYLLDPMLQTIVNDPRFALPPDTKCLEELIQAGTFECRKKPGEHNEPPDPGSITQAKEGTIEVGTVRVDVKLRPS
ncbi:MAG: trypsin-like peptidase domain-containing protein [Acidobacteria bacterium]|nr:trypsin-like peptidase domain-containing protein [Acidobacteriota bacterium]